MRVHIATDHAGFEQKEYLVKRLRDAGYDVVDHGTSEADAQDDYPEFIFPCAEAVAASDGDLGIVLGGSGNGEQIAANKVAGIRAILAYSVEIAQLGRQHNNSNIISLGARFISNENAWEIVEKFLETPFSNEERHQRRIDMIRSYEETGSIN